jgi:hypothetical protein
MHMVYGQKGPHGFGGLGRPPWWPSAQSRASVLLLIPLLLQTFMQGRTYNFFERLDTIFLAKKHISLRGNYRGHFW